MDSNKYSLLFVHELENVAQSKTPAKGRRQNRKSRKFGTTSQLGLIPPPSDLWDIFEFQTFLKNVDPPPSYQIGTFLNFRHFL